MEALVVLGIVATPFVFARWLINRIFVHREEMMRLRLPASRPVSLAPLPELTSRIANLEAIVCDLDPNVGPSRPKIPA